MFRIVARDTHIQTSTQCLQGFSSLVFTDVELTNVTNGIAIRYIAPYSRAMNEERMAPSAIHEGALSTGRGSSHARIPLSMIRKTMAKRMIQSAQEIPHMRQSLA